VKAARLVALAVLAAALLGASTGSGAPRPLTPALERQIDAMVVAQLREQFVPGAQVAIAENGRIVYTKGYGYRDLDDRLPVDAKTAFAIGSVTKQFTASAIMLLQQEGKLNVDDSLATYLPDAPHASQVTLRELLTHTSGIEGYTEQPNFSLLLPTPATPQRIISSIAANPLAFAPGTKWEYSNTNFVLLGMVVSKLSGLSYPNFLQQHFFGSLGMQRAWFTRIEEVHADDARGYTEFMWGLPDEHASLADWSWYDAAGGLTMSAEDLARWDIALDSGRVVSPQSFSEMTTPQRLTNGTSTGYGFGLGVGSVFGHPTVGHDGLVSGFSAENLTFPKDRVAIVLLANGDNFAYVPLIRAIAGVIYGVREKPRPFVPYSMPAADAARARRWLSRFLDGTPDFSKTTQDLAVTLPQYRLAQLQKSGRILGSPLDFQPAAIDHRPPLTIYYFRVRFAIGYAKYIFAVNASGQVAGFALEAWE
jgi:D-alanyl-D-alanine carboxypeptidase